MSHDKLYEAVDRQYDRLGWKRQLIGFLAALALLGVAVVVVVAGL